MKTPRDIVAALGRVFAAIENLAAAKEAHQRGDLPIEVSFHWLGTAIDQLGDQWEGYLRVYTSAQETALLDGGFEAVNDLTDHLGLQVVIGALRDRMIASGLGALVETTPREFGQVKAAGDVPRRVGSETVQ